jgi:DNA polymerase sigma
MGENCPNHSGTIERLNNLERDNQRLNQIDIEFAKGTDEVRERLTAVEESTKSAHHRIDNFNGQAEAIIRMSMSVDSLAEQVKESNALIKEQDIRHNNLIEKMEERVTALENKPGIIATKGWIYLLSLLATGLFGAYIERVIK